MQASSTEHSDGESEKHTFTSAWLPGKVKPLKMGSGDPFTVLN